MTDTQLRHRPAALRPAPAPRQKPPSRSPRRRALLPRVFLFVTALLALCGLAVAVYLASLPPVDDAEARTAAILRRHGGVDAGTPPPEKVARAIVAVEDRRFYLHHGIDTLGLVRAGWDILTTGTPHGGATISEQLAQALYVPAHDSLSTGLAKIGTAVKLERRYSKARILELYLNAIYYGDGQWGIAQAGRAYFGKSPAGLSWGEASMLAGLPNAPSAYDPRRHYDLARRRQRQVLVAMVATGVLSPAEADAVYAAPPRLVRPAGSAGR